MINPHDKVVSFDQDAWIEVIEVMRANLLRLAVSPKLSPEEIAFIFNLIAVGKNLHISLLSFDEEVSYYRDHIGDSAHQCGGSK